MIRKSNVIVFTIGTLLCFLSLFARADAPLPFTQKSIAWTQVDSKPSFTAFSERDIYSTLDKDARIVFAVQLGGKNSGKLSVMNVQWKISENGGKSLASADSPLKDGMVVIDFTPANLVPGKYSLQASFFEGNTKLEDMQSSFSVVTEAVPERSGKIPILFPTGIPLENGTYPITCGVPFPKGVLFSKDNVRLEGKDGTAVPCQTIIRSRWGNSDRSSIRWLGLDFQSSSQAAWDRDVGKAEFHLLYGPDVKPLAPPNPLKIKDAGDVFIIDTGISQISVRKKGFNLFDSVVLNGNNLISNSAAGGLYLVDHEGKTYSSANDSGSNAVIEEEGPLRSVIRIEGWYVKDGTDGKLQNYSLPTDKLCKHVTRLEFYAGKPYVRVLSTWIITYDIFSVRLKDLGINVPMADVRNATFGIEKAEPFKCDVDARGAYLVQHLHNKYDIEKDGTTLKSGEHSAGWFSAANSTASITASLRATWQNYPKEFEVLPDMLKIHIWPAHGKEHPEIDEFSHQNLTKILYAHQGKEMSLALPWKYYLTAAKILDTDKTDVYSAGGQVLAGVHSGALGAASTVDVMIDFSSADMAGNATHLAECFQTRPHAIADPVWNCASLATGYIHPQDKKNFPVMENIIEDALKGYEKTNDVTGEYGIWIFRRWHHSGYLGDGKWELYRMNNTTHHYEAFMPWLFYLRSGDPFYYHQGNDHTRNLSDVGIIHYEDQRYPQKEYHFQQKPLIGSTKHTNGFVPWGADHAVGAHLTCYNGLITAYYLTGDLRYKEVVVDEWEKTITDRRDNPEYAAADRSRNPDGTIESGQITGARDVDCFVGELIDLYQLAYNPKVLALLAPRLLTMENNPITDWGMPLQNVIQFYGSAKLRKDLKDFSEEYASTGAKPLNDPHQFCAYGAPPHMPVTLAAILEKDKALALAAYNLAAPYNSISWSKQINSLTPDGPPFCTVPDVILKYPHLMFACNATGCDINDSINQPMPVADMKQKGWTRCLIKETEDIDIDLNFKGSTVADVQIVIFDPDGKRVLSTEIKEKAEKRNPVIVPKDGKTGIYTVFIAGKDNNSKLRVPISTLPEIYCVKYWVQSTPCRFFINCLSDADRKMVITPHKAPGSITNKTGDKVLAETQNGGALQLEVPKDGIWFISKAHYVNSDTWAVLAVSPERWFAPPKGKLDLSPP